MNINKILYKGKLFSPTLKIGDEEYILDIVGYSFSNSITHMFNPSEIHKQLIRDTITFKVMFGSQSLEIEIDSKDISYENDNN